MMRAGDGVGGLETGPEVQASARPAALVNGLWNALSSGVVALAGLLASVVVVRSLSPQGYGVLSYYLWLAGLLASLGQLALPPALTKVGAELRGAGQAGAAEALAGWVGRLLLALNLGVVAALMIAAALLPASAAVLLVIAAVQLPAALASLLSSRLWSQQQFRMVSLWSMLAALVQLALIAGALWLGRAGWASPQPGLAFAVLSAGLTTSLGLAWQARGTWRAVRLPLPATVRRHYLAFVLPASLALLFETVVWQRSELYFINRLVGAAAVGHYSLAYTIFAIALSVGWALVTSYLPAIASDHGAGQPGGVRRKLQQGAALALLYAAPVSGGAVVTLGGLVRLLYGEAMQPAVPVGQLLLLGLIPAVLAGLLSLTINAVGGIWFNVALGLAVAAVNVGLDLLLIPRSGPWGGAVGGALASVAAQSLYLLGLLLLARLRFGLRLQWRGPLRLLALGLGSTLLLPALIQRVVPGLPGLVLAILAGAGLYLLLVWRSGDLRLLRPGGAT